MVQVVDLDSGFLTITWGLAKYANEIMLRLSKVIAEAFISDTFLVATVHGR